RVTGACDASHEPGARGVPGHGGGEGAPRARGRSRPRGNRSDVLQAGICRADSPHAPPGGSGHGAAIVKKRRRRTERRDRARARTEEEILAAVGRLLESSGFDELGMNAVAREAGVDKVLVYRYFGKLPDLLRAFAERGGHWPTDAELVGAAPPEAPAELA